jgi:hypothetical protein
MLNTTLSRLLLQFGAVTYPLRMLRKTSARTEIWASSNPRAKALLENFPSTGLVSFGDTKMTNYGEDRLAQRALNPQQAQWIGITVEDSLTQLMDAYELILTAAKSAGKEGGAAAAAAEALRIAKPGNVFWDALFDIPVAMRNSCFKVRKEPLWRTGVRAFWCTLRVMHAFSDFVTLGRRLATSALLRLRMGSLPHRALFTMLEVR